MTYRGIAKGAHIELDEPLPFADGQPVDVSVEPVNVESANGDAPPGSPAAILRALRQPPHLTREDVDELERAIESGKAPPTSKGIFDEAE